MWPLKACYFCKAASRYHNFIPERKRIRSPPPPQKKTIHEYSIFHRYVPWSKVAILGMVIPPLIGILIMGPYTPLLLDWVSHPLLYANNGTLIDPGAYTLLHSASWFGIGCSRDSVTHKQTKGPKPVATHWRNHTLCHTAPKTKGLKPETRALLLGCPVGKLVIKWFGSVGYFTPRHTPFISRWNIPLILTIDPSFLGHPSGKCSKHRVSGWKWLIHDRDRKMVYFTYLGHVSNLLI